MRIKIFQALLFCLMLVIPASTYSGLTRVSVITSVYNADLFIEGFLQDILRQTIFNQCEFIVINPNSPGHEEQIIKKYAAQYPNIKYIRLAKDPGLYGVWNYGIKIAQGNFITNANVDDRRNPEILAIHAQALENNPEIDLVYSDYYLTRKPNEPFESKTRYHISPQKEFAPHRMFECLPGPMPMWRKNIHKKYGYFKENYKIIADWEMWLRAVSKGSKFQKVPGFAGIFYINPQGLFHSPNNRRLAGREAKEVIQKYSYLWNTQQKRLNF